MEEQAQSYRRSWLAIGIATIVLMVSYTSLLVAIVSTQSDTPEAAGPAFALGFVMVPLVFVTVAFISGRRNAPTSVVKGMGLWVVFALPLGLFNPVFGLCAGYGIGGVVTLAKRPTDRWQARTIVVILVAAYSLLMLFVIPAIGILSGGLLPLASLGLADYFTENRAKAADQQE